MFTLPRRFAENMMACEREISWVGVWCRRVVLLRCGIVLAVVRCSRLSKADVGGLAEVQKVCELFGKMILEIV